MSTKTNPSAAPLPTFSIPSPSVSSSRRTSLESATRSSTISSPALGPSGPAVASSSAAQLAAARRNRAALRDFYGLKDKTSGPQVGEGREEGGEGIKSSELDAEGFNAKQHVSELLNRESLEGVLKIESRLVSEIRSLDGDRKALVYDNYSKLITATDTIRKMRSNMDPLAPTTNTLAPAIGYIADTAQGMINGQKADVVIKDEASEKKRDEVKTVKWVMACPGRLKGLIERGEQADAEKDWARVRPVLEAWIGKGVHGAEDVKVACEEALK